MTKRPLFEALSHFFLSLVTSAFGETFSNPAKRHLLPAELFPIDCLIHSVIETLTGNLFNL
jgi:hypothetical protein